jgi:hypothetical protein
MTADTPCRWFPLGGKVMGAHEQRLNGKENNIPRLARLPPPVVQIIEIVRII